MSIRLSKLKALTTVLVGSIVCWGQISSAQTNGFSPPLRAAQLMGAKVEDTDGQKVGTVRNFILETRTGQIRYAVIGSGGFIGINSILKVVPSQAMSAATIKRETLSINATLDQWKGAPIFRASQLNSLAQPEKAHEIARYFGEPAMRMASASETSLPGTGSWIGIETNAQPDRLKFASDIIGMRVVNRQQQKIGEVTDLLICFGRPHPAYAIVSIGKFLGRGYRYAIPLSALSQTKKGGRLVVDLDGTTLQQAPPFNQQVWNATGLEDQLMVYRYSKPGE